MKHNFRYLLFLLLAFLLLCQSAVAGRKDKGCKPIRANRNKRLAAGRLTRISIVWNDDVGKYNYERHFEKEVDTVLVYNDGKLIATLPVRNNEVLLPWIRYEMAGQQLVDTIDFEKGRAYGGYFNEFSSRHVVTTLNLTQNSHRYYNSKGGDSVTIFRYGNGVTAKMIKYNNYWDRDTLEFNRDGILSRKVVKAGVFTYHLDGTLQSRRFDTIVSNYLLTCARDYYGDGAIKSVAYFMADTPCHIWQYYNLQGSLVQSVKKRPLSSFKSNYGPVEAPRTETIFKYVEEYPIFHGNLTDYMNEKLVLVICGSRRPLSGTYSVEFMVNRDGTNSLIKVSGQNAEAITPALSTLFASMPRWHPGKKNGVAADEVFVLPITVRPIE